MALVVGKPGGEYLGGFVEGGDPWTSYPDLWDWIAATERPASLLDVGCGCGNAVAHFRGKVPVVRGLDGAPDAFSLMRPEERIVHDLTTGPFLLPSPFDVVWCCETAEHVEARFVGNLMRTLCENALKAIFFTHATPGQSGYHHVNCRPAEYWFAWFERLGWEPDWWANAKARSLAHHYFANTGVVFRKGR